MREKSRIYHNLNSYIALDDPARRFLRTHTRQKTFQTGNVALAGQAKQRLDAYRGSEGWSKLSLGKDRWNRPRKRKSWAFRIDAIRCYNIRQYMMSSNFCNFLN